VLDQAVCSGADHAGATAVIVAEKSGTVNASATESQVAEVERIAVTSNSKFGVSPRPAGPKNVSQCDARYRLESYRSATPERG
jgi:hypothetical protein